MRKLAVISIVLLAAGIAWAAVDSQVKRTAAQGFDVPVADGTIDEFDRGMLAGVYVADVGAASNYEAHRRNIFFHHHHH